MILPSFTISPNILEFLPQAQQWAEKAKENNIISIGVVGEAVRVLPGILDSIEVSDALLVDTVKQQGKSGDIKVISGWADSDVSINLLLIDIPKIEGTKMIPNISRYDCLAEMTSWFKRMKDGVPQIYTIHHPHIKAWGANEFVFNSLKSNENRTKGIITCTLEFDEYDSTAGKSQDRQIGVIITEQEKAEEPQNPPVSDHTRRGLGEIEDTYAKQ
jgi:hypothetical protein